MYAQGNKRAVGSTWAAVAEAKDFTNAANPTAGLVGLEVDIFANGTDTNMRRIGIDVVAGRGIAGGAASGTYAGIRIGPFGIDNANAVFTNGLLLQGQYAAALSLTTTGTWGLYMAGTKQVGIDLSDATHTVAAIRLKTKDAVQFTKTGTTKLFYDDTIATPGLFYTFNDVPTVGFLNSGDVVVANTIRWPGTSTATTVGAAGGASALPANPTGYVRILIDGVTFKVPYYAN
jgi:hypothetical protein